MVHLLRQLHCRHRHRSVVGEVGPRGELHRNTIGERNDGRSRRVCRKDRQHELVEHFNSTRGESSKLDIARRYYHTRPSDPVRPSRHPLDHTLRQGLSPVDEPQTPGVRELRVLDVHLRRPRELHFDLDFTRACPGSLSLRGWVRSDRVERGVTVLRVGHRRYRRMEFL